MNKKIPKIALTLLVVMLTSLTFGRSMPAFAEPKPLSKQMFDKLVAAESLDSDFDYILEKYCNTDESWKRRRIMIYNMAEEKPLKVAEDLYIFFAAEKGYLFDDSGYKYFLSLGKTLNESLVLRNIRFFCVLVVATLLSILVGEKIIKDKWKDVHISYFVIIIFLLLVCIITLHFEGEDAESRCNKIAINSVSIGSLNRIRKLRNARDWQLGKTSVPGKEALITSGNETENAMTEYLLNEGCEVEISANGNVLIRNKHSK